MKVRSIGGMQAVFCESANVFTATFETLRALTMIGYATCDDRVEKVNMREMITSCRKLA